MEIEEGVNNNVTSPVTQKPDETDEERKARQAEEYRQRLNKDKAKIRDEAARAAGFKDYEDMQKNSLDKRLLEVGIQPETGAPIVRDFANELIERDPRIIEAERIIAENKEKELKSALYQINQTFGTNFSSIDQLDDDTKNLMEKGLDVFKAYAANHFDQAVQSGTQHAQVSQKEILEASKQHLIPTPAGSKDNSKPINLSKTQFEAIRKIGGVNMSDEQIVEYIKSHQGIV